MTISANFLLGTAQGILPSGTLMIDKEKGLIESVQVDSSLLKQEDTAERGCTFLTPGLINAHTHLGLRRDTPIPLNPLGNMAQWILEVMAYNQQLSEAEKRLALQQSILEVIRTGTTTVLDIASDHNTIEAIDRIGLRAMVALEFFHPAHGAIELDYFIERYLALVKRFSSHPLITLGISPHSPYNVSPEAYLEAIERLSPPFIQTHLAETQQEIDWFLKGHSALDRVHQTVLNHTFGPANFPSRPLANLPCLDETLSVVHGVYLNPEECERLSDAGSSLIQCIRSNLWISGKTLADYPKNAHPDLKIGLGTDSRLSCPDLDMRAEGRALMQQYGLSAKQVFQALTVENAKAIGQASVLGELKIGQRADMVLWQNPQAPPHNLSEEAIYGLWLDPETTPIAVWINGRLVLER
jgi:cytosine/adenosine deaminase-related metal-dependent hydrolase